MKVNCGSCLHLNGEKVFEAKCIELGKLDQSVACASHTPDAFSLIGDSDSMVYDLSKLGATLKLMTIRDCQILASLLLNEKKTRRAGFFFMQKVYVRVSGRSGRNYVKNFALGYVLDANKDTVRIVSASGRTAVVLPIGSDALYTVKAFQPIRTEMYANRKYVDPDVEVGNAKIARAAAEMANLDDADSLGLLESSISKKRKIKKIKKGSEDLVSFVARLTRGIDRADTEQEHRRATHGDESFEVSW